MYVYTLAWPDIYWVGSVFRGRGIEKGFCLSTGCSRDTEKQEELEMNAELLSQREKSSVNISTRCARARQGEGQSAGS